MAVPFTLKVYRNLLKFSYFDSIFYSYNQYLFSLLKILECSTSWYGSAHNWDKNNDLTDRSYRNNWKASR